MVWKLLLRNITKTLEDQSSISYTIPTSRKKKKANSIFIIQVLLPSIKFRIRFSLRFILQLCSTFNQDSKFS
ncbi:hypothetical protein P8452_25287 [Trifolium repens]|nr:hypothetical protein P8452_25287 [Trifolium repens]